MNGCQFDINLRCPMQVAAATTGAHTPHSTEAAGIILGMDSANQRWYYISLAEPTTRMIHPPINTSYIFTILYNFMQLVLTYLRTFVHVSMYNFHPTPGAGWEIFIITPNSNPHITTNNYKYYKKTRALSWYNNTNRVKKKSTPGVLVNGFKQKSRNSFMWVSEWCSMCYP